MKNNFSVQITETTIFTLYSILFIGLLYGLMPLSTMFQQEKSPSCHLVVLPNKFAFEENKLINLGMVVSVTVFLFTTADMDFLLSLFIIGVISL